VTKKGSSKLARVTDKGSPELGRVPVTVRSVEDPLLKRHASANAARMSAKRSGGSATTANSLSVIASDPTTTAEKPLSRSRSLIRRMRKPKVKDSAELAVNDCVIC